MPIAAMLIELFLSILTIDTLRMSMIRWRQYERIVIPIFRWMLPTNFEYVGLLADLGHRWKLDVKPYTYGYKNH